MLTTVHHADVLERDRLSLSDPFQAAAPCWRNRVSPFLPPETQTTVVRLTPAQEIYRMAIRTVIEAQAPARMFHRGVVSNKQDYMDVLNALPAVKVGQAIVVDMDAKAWEGVKKPETTFGYALRRLFESKGLSLTAYQSGPMQVTIRKPNALDAKGKKK